MKKYAFLLFLPLALLAFVRPAHPTSFETYISVKGSKQGQFKGEAKGKGGREKDGWFKIQSFEMGSLSPADTKSGGPTAKSQRKPIVVTKEVDEASPLLLNAHLSNETLESVIIQTVDDQNKVTKTVTLTNAIISDIKKNGGVESITFNFEKLDLK